MVFDGRGYYLKNLDVLEYKLKEKLRKAFMKLNFTDEEKQRLIKEIKRRIKALYVECPHLYLRDHELKLSKKQRPKMPSSKRLICINTNIIYLKESDGIVRSHSGKDLEFCEVYISTGVVVDDSGSLFYRLKGMNGDLKLAERFVELKNKPKKSA